MSLKSKMPVAEIAPTQPDAVRLSKSLMRRQGATSKHLRSSHSFISHLLDPLAKHYVHQKCMYLDKEAIAQEEATHCRKHMTAVANKKKKTSCYIFE